ncbi:MAG: metalloregulator ArsR/SmtB family transcription factor [Actinomycetota bacterium]|nr:metalloregulator ArsR/SmtB family transcription factor [Actinomycetota bacterium]
MTASTLDRAAHAVADPTRRAILRLVTPGEQSVADIASNFDVTRPAISQHLRVLREAELVTIREVGTRRLYKARPEGLGELRGWVEGFWTDALDRLAMAAEAERREAGE